MAAALTGAQAAIWALLAAVAWQGYRQLGVQPLLWLGLQGALQALVTAFSTAGMLRPLLLLLHASSDPPAGRGGRGSLERLHNTGPINKKNSSSLEGELFLFE